MHDRNAMNKLRKPKIVKKPWGAEIWFGQVTGKYLGKVLHIKANYRTSLHYHEKKEETMLVVSGVLDYILYEGKQVKAPHIECHSLQKVGSIIHILPGVKHSLGANDKDVLLFEISTCYPTDSIRVFDFLGRKCDE